MAKPVSTITLVGDVEHACGTVASLLVDLGRSVALTQTSMLPLAAECLTAKTILGRLGMLLAPIEPIEPDTAYERCNEQIEDLKACFEVILHSISEVLLDVDHEIRRLRRYHTGGDPLASSKVIPVLQDFFIDAKYGLRRNRSSLCLMIDCLQR
ncbi:hypothetical protein F4776DRAFT_436274 [Hypoxylon sp. NC0597]|nr:hypothetical protein F4776DRAFT_436274 [Hypoxylon sp. NC0597]